MPAYKKNLADKKEFTFSMKIAKALKLSPSQFFNGADLVRSIRNEFVHNLEIKTFENLKNLESLKPKKRNLISEMENILKIYFPTTLRSDKTLQEQFKSLTLFTFVAINSFIENVRSLNSFLRDDTFLEILMRFLAKKAVN